MPSMITIDNFKKIVHFLHFDELYESLRKCHNDNRGWFLIPATAKITDQEYERYRHLLVNWSIAPITKDVLPEEFSPQAVKTVDMFRKKQSI